MSARSKLKNFAPKILLCAELIVLSIRNANIVFPKPIVLAHFATIPPPAKTIRFFIEKLIGFSFFFTTFANLKHNPFK